jgi:hypothetical protein
MKPTMKAAVSHEPSHMLVTKAQARLPYFPEARIFTQSIEDVDGTGNV